MAESHFDRARFEARLRTAWLGRTLLARAATASTNDDAAEALAAGGADGLAVVADEQVRGRGRAGRTWVHVPGAALALSVALRVPAGAAHVGLAPLAAGLALAEAVTALGAPARLKWPNDVLVGGGKLAGVLCERRRAPGGTDLLVIGMGVNVAHGAADFPEVLRARATSLALHGVHATPEDVAAEVLNAFEPHWTRLLAGATRDLLAAWSARCDAWGTRVVVSTPAGPVPGTARRLADDGALVLLGEDGTEVRVLAGDVEPAGRVGAA